jgi:hypothetical protein
MYHSLALQDNSTVYSWGVNSNGLDNGWLGYGDIASSYNPKPVVGLPTSDIIGIACGKFHSIAYTKTGEIYSWGSNQGMYCF